MQSFVLLLTSVLVLTSVLTPTCIHSVYVYSVARTTARSPLTPGRWTQMETMWETLVTTVPMTQILTSQMWTMMALEMHVTPTLTLTEFLTQVTSVR